MVYFANFQHIYFMSDLLSCTTKLDEPRVLYVCCAASWELRGLMEWSIPRIPSSRLVVSCVSPRVSYVSIPHVEYARQGYTRFKRRVSEVGRCPCSRLTHGYRFYIEGNVWGRFRDVLARKVHFLQVHNSASLVAKWVPYSSWLDIIGRDE
jgi:hypothetical protein